MSPKRRKLDNDVGDFDIVSMDASIAEKSTRPVSFAGASVSANSNFAGVETKKLTEFIDLSRPVILS